MGWRAGGSSAWGGIKGAGSVWDRSKGGSSASSGNQGGNTAWDRNKGGNSTWDRSKEAVLPGKVEVLGKVVTILHGEVRKVIPVHGVVTDTKKCCFLTEVCSLVSSSLLLLFIYVDDYCFEFCISTYSFMYTTFLKKYQI